MLLVKLGFAVMLFIILFSFINYQLLFLNFFVLYFFYLFRSLRQRCLFIVALFWPDMLLIIPLILHIFYFATFYFYVDFINLRHSLINFLQFRFGSLSYTKDLYSITFYISAFNLLMHCGDFLIDYFNILIFLFMNVGFLLFVQEC